MALLNEKCLAAEAAKRARYRVHHVGTKLNEAELHELEALAAKRNETQAELIRGLVLREHRSGKAGLAKLVFTTTSSSWREQPVQLPIQIWRKSALRPRRRNNGRVDNVRL
jgi:hypothetical protein